VEKGDKTRSQIAVQLAVYRIGSAPALAREIGVRDKQVYRWAKGEQEISAENATRAAAASKLRRSDFRPDLWDDEDVNG